MHTINLGCLTTRVSWGIAHELFVYVVLPVLSSDMLQYWYSRVAGLVETAITHDLRTCFLLFYQF